MATVYLAADLRHDRQVAVKVLRPDLAATLGPERFLREIKIAAQLQHPNILPLLDSGEADDFLYYVMPYVEGQSLRERLAREGALPIGDAVRILRDVVDALTEAHINGVVHRDIKPENVLLRGRHALVTDFGVAKAVSEATGRTQLTTAGVALGTPAYMAPEQAAADPHVDHRVDIYAVGAVAYELLTGRPVFMGTTPQMVLSAHMAEPPQPVTMHRDTVPAALEALVMRCLEKKPADRWQSAEELLPQLEALTTPSGGMTPTDTRPIATPSAKRRWAVSAVLGGIAVAIGASFLAAPLFRSKPISVTTSNIRAVTSDPGIDITPALSPDGSRVAFTALRQGTWSIAIRSTRTMEGEVTPAPAPARSYENFARWSADGGSVRFFICRGLECSTREVGALGGSTRTVDLPVDTYECSWSPNDSRVACVAEPDTIFVRSFDEDTTTIIVVPSVAWAIHSLTWSPDGNRIAYVNGNPAWRYRFNVSATSIWTMHANGSEPARVTGDESMDVSPAWLDDEHLLFVSDRDGPREVYVVPVGRTGARGEPRKVPGIIDPHSISYSVAGGNLAYTKGTERQNVWAFPRGRDTLTLADGQPVTDDNAVIEDHDISRDGRRITYCQDLRGSMDIYVRSIDGGNPVQVTDLPGDEFGPRWSPDGTEIAFYTDRSVGGGTVGIVASGGGTPVMLASGGSWRNHPRWSPDGLHIAFSAHQTGRRDVWLVSRDEVGGSWGEPEQVTTFGCFLLDWDTDGGGVLCRSAAEGWVGVAKDGTIVRRYPTPEERVFGEGLRQYSPDNSGLYFPGTHEDGRTGIWVHLLPSGEVSLAMPLDWAEYARVAGFLSVGPSHLYLTIGDYETDIWVADVEVTR
jgi:serine/threonine-protein kinase